MVVAFNSQIKILLTTNDICRRYAESIHVPAIAPHQPIYHHNTVPCTNITLRQYIHNVWFAVHSDSLLNKPQESKKDEEKTRTNKFNDFPPQRPCFCNRHGWAQEVGRWVSFRLTVATLQKVIQDAFVASLSNIHPNAPQTQRYLLKFWQGKSQHRY